MLCKNILESIGHTPLVRLNRLTTGFAADVYVKADYMNPGGSVKDRIGVSMIDEAERQGLLKPGGTIIEGTSGNTGIGLALVGAVRGYKLVFTITDKQSKEKVDLLKALGAFYLPRIQGFQIFTQFFILLIDLFNQVICQT